MRSSAGCDWLIGRWTLLGNGLSTADEGGPGCTWADADLALALNLLGIPAELRHLDDQTSRLESLCMQARSGSDEAVTELRDIVAAEVAELERRSEEVWEGVEQPWLQDLYSGLEIDFGPDGTRLRRCEMAAERLFRSAWTKLERLRNERDEALIQYLERGFAAEPVARPEPPSVPPPEPFPPEPAPGSPEAAVPAPASLDDQATVLDFWVGGPPRPGINLGSLFQNKTNPTPIRPANGGRAARPRNLL